MAIKTYTENGNTLYHVYVNQRSLLNPKIRVQKRQKGIDSKSKALRIEMELIRECVDAVRKLEGFGKSWGEIVEAWSLFMVADSDKEIGSDTFTDYKASMKKWTRDWWEKPAKSINKGDIRGLISEMEINGISKSFQQKTKSVVHRIFTWGLEERLIRDVSSCPTLGVKISRKNERKPQILNADEIRRLLLVAKRTNDPWYPIWAMAILTGCRNGELFALTWDNVDFSVMTLRVSKSFNKRQNLTKSTKAGYWRTVPINADLATLLRELKLQSKGKPEILPRLRDWRQGNQAKILRVFCLGIGITTIRFHDLRACFATQLLQNGVAPVTVMKICGWKDMDTMACYIRMAGIDEAGATDSLAFTPTEAGERILKLEGFES